MAVRKASAFVCDEALFSLNGKITISGMYTQDIVIQTNEQQVGQLVFFFTIETPKEEPFETMTLKVSLPGSDPISIPGNVIAPNSIPDEKRKSIIYRQPVLIPLPTLRPGRIVATVVHEKGEMEAGGFWIVTLEEAQLASAGQIKPHTQG